MEEGANSIFKSEADGSPQTSYSGGTKFNILVFQES